MRVPQRVVMLISTLMLTVLPWQAELAAQPLQPKGGRAITADNGAGIRLMAFRPLKGAGEALWSPGGSLMAVSVGSRVLVFETDNLYADPIELAQDGEVTDLAWSPDGRILAVASRDGMLRLWAISVEQVIQQKALNIRDMAYSPDGSVIAYIGFEDAALHLWDTLDDEVVTLQHPISSELVQQIDGILPGTGVDFSPDGRFVAAGRPDGTALIWHVTSGQMQTNITPGTQAGSGGVLVNPDDGTAFSRRGGLVAVANTRLPRSIMIAEVQSGTIRHLLSQPGAGLRKTFISLAFNPSGTLLAAAGGDYEGDPINDGLTLWNLANGEVLASLNHPNVRSVVFSPDGTQLLSSGGDELRLWKPADQLYTTAEGRNLTNWLVDAFCDADEPQFQARRLDSITVGWSWFAISSALIDSHIANALYTITLDGTPVEGWIFVTAPQQEVDFFNNWTVYYYLPLGIVAPGVHEIGYQVEWRQIINDGYDVYGPGTRNPTERGSCHFAVISR